MRLPVCTSSLKTIGEFSFEVLFGFGKSISESSFLFLETSGQFWFEDSGISGKKTDKSHPHLKTHEFVAH